MTNDTEKSKGHGYQTGRSIWDHSTRPTSIRLVDHGNCRSEMEERMQQLMNYDEFSGLAQALFEESRVALFLLDSGLERILDANAAAQRLCGFSLRHLTSLRVVQLFKSADTQGLRPLPRSARSVRRLFQRSQCQLRSYEEDTWLPADIVLTRLVVKPKALTLLKVRATKEQFASPLNA